MVECNRFDGASKARAGGSIKTRILLKLVGYQHVASSHQTEAMRRAPHRRASHRLEPVDPTLTLTHTQCIHMCIPVHPHTPSLPSLPSIPHLTPTLSQAPSACSRAAWLGRPAMLHQTALPCGEKRQCGVLGVLMKQNNTAVRFRCVFPDFFSRNPSHFVVAAA